MIKDSTIFFQISFVRRRDLHILTNGHLVFTADQRFEIFHAAKSHDWYLILKRVTHADAGTYECQVKFSTKLIFHQTDLVVEICVFGILAQAKTSQCVQLKNQLEVGTIGEGESVTLVQGREK